MFCHHVSTGGNYRHRRTCFARFVCIFELTHYLYSISSVIFKRVWEIMWDPQHKKFKLNSKVKSLLDTYLLYRWKKEEHGRCPLFLMILSKLHFDPSEMWGTVLVCKEEGTCRETIKHLKRILNQLINFTNSCWSQMEYCTTQNSCFS